MNDILYRDDKSKFCSDCGKIVKVQAEICPYCGCRQMLPPLVCGKSRIAAVLFAFFLGGFGAHKFYLGKIYHYI